MKGKKKILKPIKNKLTARLEHEKRNSTDPCPGSTDRCRWWGLFNVLMENNFPLKLSFKRGAKYIFRHTETKGLWYTYPFHKRNAKRHSSKNIDPEQDAKSKERAVILKIFIFKKNVRLPFSHLSTLLPETPIKRTVKELQKQCKSMGTKAIEERKLEVPAWGAHGRNQSRLRGTLRWEGG